MIFKATPNEDYILKNKKATYTPKEILLSALGNIFQSLRYTANNLLFLKFKLGINIMKTFQNYIIHIFLNWFSTSSPVS